MRAPAKPQRNHALDLAKCVAAFGVVALHVRHSTDAARLVSLIFWPTCVPFFYLASLTFFIGRMTRESPGSVVLKQAKRVVIPYLAWTCVYLVLLNGKAFLTGVGREFDFVSVFLYGGSAVHLYFIPNLLIYQLIALSVYLIWSRPIGRKGAGVVGLAAGIAYLVCGAFHHRFGAGNWGNIGAVLFYLVAATILSRGSIVSGGFKLGIVGVILWTLAIFLNFQGLKLVWLDYPMILPIGGLGFYLLAISIKLHVRNPWMQKILTSSFGIYLSHVVFLEALESAFSLYGLGSMEIGLIEKLGFAGASFICGVLFTMIVRRYSQAGRQVLLGES